MKNLVKKIYTDYWDLIVITLIMIVFTLLFSHDWKFVLTDRGREFFLAQEVLNGKVPYKDITLIYFPFAYYINALVFKIFGTTINSLIIFQAIVCNIAVIIYYFLAKEFLNKKTALLTTILIITCCIFSPLDLFSYIIPYSYGRVYGVSGFWVSTYSLVKLLKTKNVKYAYLASLFTGFTLCCKLEFLPILFLLIIGLFFYRKLNLSQIAKIFGFLLIFPFIILGILFGQGVTIKNIFDSLMFGFKFAKTPVMVNFLSEAGMYPFHIQEKLNYVYDSAFKLVKMVVTCYVGFLFYTKSKIWLILPFTALIVVYFQCGFHIIANSWLLLPIILTVVTIYKFKYLYQNDKLLLILLVSAIFLSQREFFHLSLFGYGPYSLPLELLSLIVLINKFLPKFFGSVKIKNLVDFILVVFILLYSYNLCIYKTDCKYQIVTQKGTVYTYEEMASMVNRTIEFIEKNVNKNETILALPEGNFLNFVTDRKVDMKCFMMDRLYHDAYGEKTAQEKIANTRSDYIILIEGLDNNTFKRPYLYDKNSTLASKYIYQNYKKVETVNGINGSKIIILKKK